MSKHKASSSVTRVNERFDSDNDRMASLSMAESKKSSQAPVQEVFSKDDLEMEQPAVDAQPGVRKIEAVTLVWSKKWLIVTLVL